MSDLVNGPGLLTAGPPINSLLYRGLTSGTQANSYLKLKHQLQIIIKAISVFLSVYQKILIRNTNGSKGEFVAEIIS